MCSLLELVSHFIASINYSHQIPLKEKLMGLVMMNSNYSKLLKSLIIIFKILLLVMPLVLYAGKIIILEKNSGLCSVLVDTISIKSVLINGSNLKEVALIAKYMLCMIFMEQI